MARRIYVGCMFGNGVDSDSTAVLRYDGDTGVFIDTILNLPIGEGTSQTFLGMAHNAGLLYILTIGNTLSDNDYRVHIIQVDGTPVDIIEFGAPPGPFVGAPLSIYVTGPDEIYIGVGIFSPIFETHIQKFDSSGTLLDEWTITTVDGASSLSFVIVGNLVYWVGTDVGSQNIVHVYNLSTDMPEADLLTAPTHLRVVQLQNGDARLGIGSSELPGGYNIKISDGSITSSIAAAGAQSPALAASKLGYYWFMPGSELFTISAFENCELTSYPVVFTLQVLDDLVGMNALAQFLVIGDDQPDGTCGGPPPGVTHKIRRLRRFPLPFDRNLTIFLTRIEFLLQMGVGLPGVVGDPGYDPTFDVRFSVNGGKTWGNIIRVRAGRQGEYELRAVISRIGSGRNWVCEIACSDPVFWYFLDTFIDVSESNS